MDMDSTKNKELPKALFEAIKPNGFLGFVINSDMKDVFLRIREYDLMPENKINEFENPRYDFNFELNSMLVELNKHILDEVLKIDVVLYKKKLNSIYVYFKPNTYDVELLSGIVSSSLEKDKNMLNGVKIIQLTPSYWICCKTHISLFQSSTGLVLLFEYNQ